ncbi:MAG: hypothetical protein ACQETE_09385 [Bacteroidota bacterium]
MSTSESNASQEQPKNIEERKKEIESELDQIQQELDHSFDEMREDVTRQFEPKEIIKRHPLTSVGVSVLAGFLFGSASGKSRSRKSSTSSRDDGFSNLIWDEIKSSVSKKAISMLVDYVDRTVQHKLDELDPSRSEGDQSGT